MANNKLKINIGTYTSEILKLINKVTNECIYV